MKYAMQGSYSGGVFEVVMILALTVGVFVLAYLTSRFLAKRTTAMKKGGALELVDRLILGRDKQILLIKVGREYFLVGLSAQSIEFSQPVDPGDFAAILAEKKSVVFGGGGSGQAPSPWQKMKSKLFWRQTWQTMQDEKDNQAKEDENEHEI